ncbi:tripartite tricarboxylate transporter substrate binding protein [Verticiella sediminum]|uniref:Tripartite tricarboxylate transporter substrate binding protein n=1 Tax=Verticiella sediminum TaxID=1247510 RepID=A0A556AKL3_9BURK|nr:tripartite tricarboxylate transporter substrate binding protein [Verticiella sediminum]TSH93432.1 tripartite tricarboxylate transporter substrate binding protein [Verticiella sediminum]
MKRFLAFTISLTLAATAVAADTWPSRSIRYIVPFGAGGSTDTLSRVIAERLQQRLGQPVVIENIGGVGGSIGMARLSRAVPDGYTIGLGNTASHAITPVIQPVKPYDPIEGFTPITLLAEYHNVLVVNAALPAKDLSEFIALAQRSDTPLAYGSSGVGSSNHLTSELLARGAGANFTHIPYKGNNEAMTAVAAGHVDWMFATASEVQPFVAAGKVRALATSGQDTEPLLPDVPPIASVLPGFSVVGWMALFGPSHLPKAIADRINKEVVDILADPQVAARYEALGLRVVASTQAEATRRVAEDYESWKAVSEAAGVGGRP